MRYAGQNYEREVPLPPGPFTAAVADQMVANFGRAHDDFYGFSLEDEPVEFVNLRVSAIGPTDLQTTVQLPATQRWSRRVASRVISRSSYLETPVYRRELLGPGSPSAGPQSSRSLMRRPSSILATRSSSARMVSWTCVS